MHVPPTLSLLVRARNRRRVARFYRTFVKPGDLCFDIGANIGDRTRALLSIGASVVAVEPQPQCVKQLRRIGSERLTVVAAGVGEHPGVADLRPASASTIASMNPDWIDSVRSSGRFIEETWSKSITVPLTTLDALIGEHGVPAFCKVDVEGYERQVIAGLSQALPLLSFEFVPEYAQPGLDIVRRLDDLGMRWFNFSEGESQRLEWMEWRGAEALIEHLKSVRAPRFGDIYAVLRRDRATAY